MRLGFPGGSDVKVSACDAGDPGLILGLGRSPGEANSNPIQAQFSSLEDGEGKNSAGALCLKIDYPQSEEKQNYPWHISWSIVWRLKSNQSVNSKIPWLGFYFLNH